MNAPHRHVTADELFAMPDDGFRYELDGGEVVPDFRCKVSEIFV